LRVKALEGLEKYSEALDFINQNYKFFLDKTQREDMLARICAKKGFTEKAIDHYKNMLEINSCNYDTYYKILKTMGFELFDQYGAVKKQSADEQKRIKQTLLEYQKIWPRVDAHIRIAMKWVEGDDFKTLLKQFIRPLLIKGVPSVIQAMKEFYADDAKIAIIQEVLFEFLASMDKQMTLDPTDKQEQDPTVYLWLVYFISYHFMFLRDNENALKFVNKGIEHTPTLIDLYTLKGKIMQQAGDRVEAARLFEEARALDTADRALNAISACYQVKAGKIE